MYSFSVDHGAATITVTLTKGHPGPETTMYFPRNAEVVLGSGSFTINGKLYTPTIEERWGLRKITIVH